eukprot:scaffold447_cov307-Pinguiococcus_pyrenoidosus.AAC.5
MSMVSTETSVLLFPTHSLRVVRSAAEGASPTARAMAVRSSLSFTSPSPSTSTWRWRIWFTSGCTSLCLLDR